MTREKEFEKQKTVRELAYTELKLELLGRCCIIHYIPSDITSPYSEVKTELRMCTCYQPIITISL